MEDKSNCFDAKSAKRIKKNVVGSRHSAFADAVGNICLPGRGRLPDGGVESVIRAQAWRTAEARIRRVSAHMALEAQSLPKEQARQKIEERAAELVRDMPSDFWEVR